MKTLSIVLPIYNVEKYLAGCLDSVLCPAYKDDYEIIGVNDGSTDSSAEILEAYRSKYPSLIRVITKENGGLGSARNAAILPAEGEFIYFLDSDDTLSPGAVGEMLETCRECGKAGADICFFDFTAVNEEGKILEQVEGAKTEGIFTLESDPEILLCRTNAGNKIFRRELFLRSGLRFRDREWYEDVSCILLLYPLAEKLCYRKASWYNYLLRPGSIMNNSKIERNAEIISACEAMNSFYTEQGLFEKYHEQLEYFCFYNILIAATVRVNLIDPKSEIQDRLLEYFLQRFPDYRKNRYVRTAPKKFRLLDYLITHRMRGAVHLLMSANDKLRH